MPTSNQTKPVMRSYLATAAEFASGKQTPRRFLEDSLALLEQWGRELDACYEGRARHPVFVALTETIRACAITKEPFADLLTAFR